MLVESLLCLRKSLKTPDLSRDFGNIRIDVLRLGDRLIAHYTAKPGWRWSRDIKPLVNKPSCECSHLQYVIRGRLAVRMDDGTQIDLRPGDVAEISPGHDAWVVGDEPFEAVEFGDIREMVKFLESGGTPVTGPSEEYYVEGD